MSEAQEPQVAPEEPAETVIAEEPVASEPAAPSSDAPDEGSIPGQEPAHAEPGEENKGFRRRIGRLTDDLRATQAQLHALQQQAAEQQRRPEPQQEPPPKLDDYDDTEAYIKAQIEYGMRGEVQALLEQERREQEHQAAMAQWQEMNNAWNQRQDTARERYPDFDEVAKGHDHQVSDAMANTIVQHDMGPDIAYYLGKNPTESNTIAQMPPFQAAAELGRIAERLKRQQRASNKRSAAPPPPEPGRGAAVQASPNALNDDMSSKDWIKLRRKQVHGK